MQLAGILYVENWVVFVLARDASEMTPLALAHQFLRARFFIELESFKGFLVHALWRRDNHMNVEQHLSSAPVFKSGDGFQREFQRTDRVQHMLRDDL